MTKSRSDEQLMFQQYEPLVRKIVKKFKNSKDPDNLFGVGSLALLKAIRAYRPERNTKFSTFAYRIVLNDICDEIKKEKKYEDLIDAEYVTNESFSEYIPDCITGNDREILGLRLSGYKLHEIASTLSLSTTTIHNSLARTKECLTGNLEY